MQQFNPIQSKWVVALQMRSVGLLQQSIPFLVAILYIMVQNFKFSFIICSCKSKENISFAHNFILIQNTNQATHGLDFHLSIFFLVKGLCTSDQLQSILTLIVQTIVSAVLGAFSKQQQGALRVSLDAFSINTKLMQARGDKMSKINDWSSVMGTTPTTNGTSSQGTASQEANRPSWHGLQIHKSGTIYTHSYAQTNKHMYNWILLNTCSSIDLFCNQFFVHNVHQVNTTLSLVTNAGMMTTNSRQNCLAIALYGLTPKP